MTRLIDADALMEIYARYEFTSDMGDAMEILANFPTVDAVPIRHGKWMPLNRYDGKVFCPDCKKVFDWDTEAQYYDYCPKCGAKMDERKEE